MKRELFGNNTSYYPILYFEVGIPILVERLHLPQSQYFKDIDYSKFKKMTIFPLYVAFYTEEQYREVLKKGIELSIPFAGQKSR